MSVRMWMIGACIYGALVTAAGWATFAARTPSGDFVESCVVAARYPSREQAVDRCEEELHELLPDRKVGTAYAAGATLLVIPVGSSWMLVLYSWLSLSLRRR